MSQGSGEIGVFISYSHKDRVLAEVLAQHLRDVGYRPWVDFSGIVGGDAWQQSIETGLGQSSILIVLLTPEAVASDWVRYEIKRAMECKCPIVPVLMRDCAIPAELETIQHIDFRQGLEGAFNQLQRALLMVIVRGDRVTAPTFSGVSLPATSIETSDSGSKSTNSVVDSESEPRRKPKALVVEDLANYQNLLRDLLADMGLEVDVAGTRTDATEFIYVNTYAFITLDMQLGADDELGQEGAFLLSLLKRYQPNAPVVMITSLDFDKEKVASFFADHGIRHLLGKPIDQLKLRELVKRLVVDLKG